MGEKLNWLEAVSGGIDMVIINSNPLLGILLFLSIFRRQQES